MTNCLRMLLGLLLLVGCGGPASQPDPSSPPVVPQVVKAPFEYKIIEKDETDHFMGPQIALTLETTNEVAKQATEDDLHQLWSSLQPTVGDRSAFIDLKTPVPGVNPWGVITRLKDSEGKWSFSLSKNEYCVDAAPHWFMYVIDKSKNNHDEMVVTLPVVNRIIETLTRKGWKLKTRKVDSVEMETSTKTQFLRVTLWPEYIYLYSSGKDDLAFTDTLLVLVNELGIGDDLKSNLQAVVGGPEYMRAASDKPAKSEWTIGEYLVRYYHYPKADDLEIVHAKTATSNKRKKAPTK